MDISHYKKKGYVGLANLGNTCFLNSCIQILNHTYPFVELMKSAKIQKIAETRDIPDTRILNSWLELVNMVWDCDEPCVITPQKFLHDVHKIARLKGRELFTGWGQNDITEFLLFMIECMHNSISRGIDVVIRGSPCNKRDQDAISCYEMMKSLYAKEYSEIMEMFYGIYMSEMISTNNTVVSSKPEHFFILDLPIPCDLHTPNLYDCFNEFVSSEKMCGENAWWNEKQGERKMSKRKSPFGVSRKSL